MNEEIEKLRAAVIVDAAVLQALVENLPEPIRSATLHDIAVKLEGFTVRTLNSTMNEGFATARQERAESWQATLARARLRP